MIQGFNNWYPAFFSDFITTFQSHSYKLYQAQGLCRVCLSLYVVLCLAVYLYDISVFLSFYLSLCMAVFWYVSMSIYLYGCLLVCMYYVCLSLCMDVFWYVCKFISLYDCLLVYLYVYLSLWLYFGMSVFWYICMSISLCVCLLACLYVYLSVWLYFGMYVCLSTYMTVFWYVQVYMYVYLSVWLRWVSFCLYVCLFINIYFNLFLYEFKLYQYYKPLYYVCILECKYLSLIST